MARPKLEIDARTVEGFAKLGATTTEIADHFNCDEGTIRKRFSEIITKSRADRKIRLRQLQWQLAEKGNLGMQIWLGKQELGQTDKIEQKTTLLDETNPISREQAEKEILDIAARLSKSKCAIDQK